MTQQPNVQLVLPNPNDPSDAANLQAIVLWAVNHVVNQIVAGAGVQLDTQTQAQGKGATGIGIVTISSTGTGYTSLTGPGKTTTPGQLTQHGGFEVLDLTGVGIGLGTNSAVAIVGDSGVSIEAPSGPVTILADGSAASWKFAQLGFEFPDTSTFYTAANLGALPVAPTNPSWGFTQDGHIYFWPSGGPWTLKV